MSSVLESILEYGTVDHLNNYLSYCEEARLFSCENEGTISAVAITNRLLNESSTRLDGLLILKCLLGQLPLKLLQANIVSWIPQAVKGLSQSDSASTVFVAAELTGMLLRISIKFAECRKLVATTSIHKILEVLYELKNSPEFLKIVLASLYIVLEQYGKSVQSWKDKFEKFMISVIERDKETVFFAARCYLALGAAGPPGTESVNYKDNWVTQSNSISSSLHSILNRLFENVNEIEQFSRGRVKIKPNYTLPIVNDQISFIKMTRLTAQFAGLCQFLEVLLLGQYPVSKKVTPELVLSVACRGLAISSQTLQSQETSDTAALLTQLPQLHLCCLSILNALMRSCGKNLLSYGPVICKLLSQVLKPTEMKKAVHGQHKPLRSVRRSTYECLTLWLTITSCSSGIEKCPEVVDFLIADIQYKQPVVTLNMSSKILKGKLGKRQRQALVNQTVDNREEYTIDKDANRDLCSAALQVVPILLDSASTFLPPKTHKALQESVCSELLATHLNFGENAPLPYSDKDCRLGLYKCFLALCHDYHPEFPPPLSFACQILSGGLQDTSPEVGRFCAAALSAMDKMLRPIGPTLGFPMELPELLAPPKSAPTLVCNDRRMTPSSVEKIQTLAGVPLGGYEPNGRKLNDSPVAVELEVSSMLIDTEMSEFDYSHSEKCADNAVISPPEKDTKVFITGQCSTGASKMDDETSDSHEPERLITNNDRLLPLENGNSSKRKPVENVEELLAPKKLKSQELLSEPVVHLPDSSDPTTTEGSTPSTALSADVNEERAIEESVRNVVEEEMLSSFVDEVV